MPASHVETRTDVATPSIPVATFTSVPRPRFERRRKYIFTARIDQRIREIYLSHPNAKTRPGIRQLAGQIGIPHWALKKGLANLAWLARKRRPGVNQSSSNAIRASIPGKAWRKLSGLTRMWSSAGLRADT